MILRLGEIDLKKKPISPQLFLCKPNKVEISKLSESYNISLSLKLGALNELKLSIPQFIDKNHKLIRNTNADVIKGRYIIKLILGSYEEYFTINNISKTGNNEEYLEIDSLSLGFELNDKIIREYTAVSKSATELLNDILINTSWSIGYIDSEFDLKKRGLEISSNTVQELVFQVAETFNALVVWDTINRKINFYKPDNVGIDRGFNIKYGKYLESLNLDDNAEELITRLKLYGKDDVTIRSVNPLGTVYIEDFSVFLYPFQRATDRTVISHSSYMSDELCHAILDYDALVSSKKTDFATLLATKKVHTDNLDNKSNELFGYETTLKQLLDDRDILNSRIAYEEDQYSHYQNGYDREYGVIDPNTGALILGNISTYTQQRDNVLVSINSTRGLINTVNSEITAIELSIASVDTDINNLKTLLSIENNFTPALIEERNYFVIEKEWQDSNIENPSDLLKEGKVALEELKKQKVTLKISIVNFLSIITEQNNWDKLNLGDIIKIEHERLNVLYNAKLTQIDYDFENNSVSIEISNVKDLKDKDKFLSMIYKSMGASTQVSIDKWKWDLSLENNGSINEIINNKWDANKQAIIGAKDQVIEISDRGLLIRDPSDPNTYLIGINSMIAITNDGGATFKHAITSTGIVGERIYGKVIMGVNLAIEDIDGVLKFQGSKGQIFDRTGDLVMKLGLISNPSEPDAFGLTAFNDITRVTVSDKLGFAIERANVSAPNGWEKIFWADQSDGTIYGHDLVIQNLKITNDVGKEILNAETDYFDIGSFKKIVTDNKLTSIEKLQIITELNKIHSNYKILLSQADDYIRVTRDNIFDINAQTFSSTPSTVDRFSKQPLIDKYTALINYMSSYVKVLAVDPLSIDINDPLTESTSDITDRVAFVLKFQDYYAEAERLRNAIEDAIYYTGMNMGEFYNNVVIGDFGFIALRNDNKFRAYLNATNGLALQKWTGTNWESVLSADINGVLTAEDLVANRLIMKNSGDILIDGYNKIIDFSKFQTVLGQIKADNLDVHGLRVLNTVDEVTFEVDSTGRVSIFTYDTTKKDTTTITGGFIEAKGTYTRNWNTFYSVPATETKEIALRFENGYIEAKDNTLNRSLYYSDFGITSKMDASGSGSIEFFSKVYDDREGLTLSSKTGTIGLIASHGYINISPEFEDKGTNTFSFQVVDGLNPDGLLRYGDHTVGFSSALRFSKNESKIYAVDGTSTLGSGTFIADNFTSYNGETLTIKCNNSNYIEISTTGIKIVGTRIDLN